MSKEFLGIALFGIGRAGSIHLDNLTRDPRCHVLYVVEEDVERARDIVRSRRMTDSITVLPIEDQVTALEDPRVDGVYVCTPTFSHEAIVRNALKHGKGVFCEKPVSQTTDGVASCYQEAERVKKPLLCAFNRRFDPSIAGIHDRIRAGAVGKVHVVKTCSRDGMKPPIEYVKTSGGIFHDCAIHDIDLVCWLLKEYPTSVCTHAHAHDEEIGNVPDVDTAVMVMKFPSGAIGVIDVSRAATYGYDQRLEVFGSEGMLLSNNQQPDGIVVHTGSGITSSCLKPSFLERYSESYIGIDRHFLDVLNGKTELTMTREQTTKSSIIASALEKSYREEKTIKLSWDR